MPGSGDASGTRSDRPDSDVATSQEYRHLPLDFSIDTFLGAEDKTAFYEASDSPGWRHKLSGSGIPRSAGDIVFSLTINLLKKTITAAILIFLVVFLFFGPKAPWDELKWNILRGGPNEASLAQCEDIGEWFSLFDQHTDRINRLLEEAGSPNSWDEATMARVADLMPQYINGWLLEIQRNDPPPAAQELNDLFVTLLENYGDYVLALQEGDLKAQKYFERENSIIVAGLDIETRHLMNLCI